MLYVGKAKNLKKRVHNYSQLNRLEERIKKMVLQAVRLQFQTLDSELEAILIEAELIRLHQPIFNILLKDDKSPLYLIITKEKFPRLITTRKKDLYSAKSAIQNQNTKLGTVLGPFPSSYKLNEVLKIVRKIFKWCDKPCQKKPCFYYHLDQCSGACIEQVNPIVYQKNIKNLIAFMRGQKKQVEKNIRQQMLLASDQQQFEQAGLYKEQLQLIKEVTSKQYQLRPELILPRLNQSQNAHALIHLKKIINTYLSLPTTYQFKRLEGYDVSNIQGKNAAVSMVCFTNGQADKKNYRLFNIKTIDTPNDYQMLKEALARRQHHPEWGRPDLLVIDGGKGQVKSALQVWQWPCPVIGLAKHPDRLIIPLLSQSAQRQTTARPAPLSYQIIKLPSHHPTLHLIQQIRDEAHRFAKKQHTRLRNAELLS